MRVRWVSALVAPLLLAAVGTGVTLAAVDRVHRSDRARVEATLDRRVASSATQMEQTLRSYVDLTSHTAGLLGAAQGLDEGRFDTYVVGLDLAGHYPGATGLSFYAAADDAGLPALSRQLAAGHPRATVTAAGGPDHAVALLTRRADGSRPTYGMDLMAVPEPAWALRHARDTGVPALSPSYVLLRDRALPPEQQELSFVLVAPVYAGGRTPSDVPGRRAALRGWVLVGLRGPCFLLGTAMDAGRTLDLRLYDGLGSDARLVADLRGGVNQHVSPAAHLVAGAGAGARAPWLRSRTLALGERHWTLLAQARPGLFHDVGRSSVWGTAAIGAALTLLLVVILGLLAGGRRRRCAWSRCGRASWRGRRSTPQGSSTPSTSACSSATPPAGRPTPTGTPGRCTACSTSTRSRQPGRCRWSRRGPATPSTRRTASRSRPWRTCRCPGRCGTAQCTPSGSRSRCPTAAATTCWCTPAGWSAATGRCLARSRQPTTSPSWSAGSGSSSPAPASWRCSAGPPRRCWTRTTTPAGPCAPPRGRWPAPSTRACSSRSGMRW